MNISMASSDVDDFFVQQQAGESLQIWVEKAVTGKVSSCRRQFQKVWYPKLIDRGISIPADESEFIALVRQQEDFVESTTPG